MNVFAFDIETMPDIQAGRRLYGLQGLDDAAVVQAMRALRRQHADGTEFLRLHLQRVVVISIAGWVGDRFRIWSIGEADASEADILARFFKGIERYLPLLVSWNGNGFDLPVLHYRSLIHRVQAPRYWDTGSLDREFRWNNYLNRFHERHTDLMDVLAGYQPRANAPLDDMASLCGFPGKMGMSGAQVWEQLQAGHFDAVRDYCETDALNTYLLYRRFELLRGNLSQSAYDQECGRVKEVLRQGGKAHLDAFLSAWEAAGD